MEFARSREGPHRRLDEAKVHVFSAEEIAEELRGESEYRRNHHTGITLMKTGELRVLLQVAEAGAKLDSHVVRGPATIFVIEGTLEIETQERDYRGRHGDMIVIPRDEARRITCPERTTFLLALSPSSPGPQAL